MDALRLKQNGILRLEEAAGVVVEVTKGEVWLTQERDPRDYFLRAGDWLRIDRPETVVISAVASDTWIVLSPLHSQPGRVVLSGLGSKGPLQVYPAQRPELVARLLATLGLSQTISNAIATRQSP